MNKDVKKILILCTGNSCRSQMAEGYLRSLSPTGTLVYSAGIETHGLNQRAVRVMGEDGIDISNQQSNHVDEYAAIDFDLILTVCDHAQQKCPYFPSNAIKIHQSFPDPAQVQGSEEVILLAFRNCRDLIKTYCAQLVEQI